MGKVNIDRLLELTTRLNSAINSDRIKVPVLDDSSFFQEYNKNVIFMARNDKGMMEQFVADGPLNDNESIEDRIRLNINDSKKYLMGVNCELKDDNVAYLDNFENDDFNFKIYAQDVIREGKFIVRSLIAYFVDDKKEFYQITLSSGPFNLGDIEEISKMSDVDNDDLIIAMKIYLNKIIKNTIYKTETGN